MRLLFNVFQTLGSYGFANRVPGLLIREGFLVTQCLTNSVLIAIAAPFGPLSNSASKVRLLTG